MPTSGPTGRDWHVSTHPSATSSGVSALFTRIVTDPSVTSAMHVAQLPCSHEKGGLSEARRAASSTVSPGTCSSTWRLRLISDRQPGRRGLGAGSVIRMLVGWQAVGRLVARAAREIDDRVQEAFDGDPIGRNTGRGGAGLDDVHERGRATDEDVRVGRTGVGEERRDVVGGHVSLVGVEMMVHGQPVRMRGGEFVDGGAEDDRGIVAVGVEQPDGPCAAVEGLLDDREHRRDSAAAAERDDRAVVVVPFAEDTGGRHHLEFVAGCHMVVQPVRHHTAGHALHGDGKPVVDGRGARHRVAAHHVVAADVGADRAELPGLVVIEVAERFRHVHHVRARVGGLLDDVEHRQRVVRVASDGVELVRRRHHTVSSRGSPASPTSVLNTTLYENGNAILMPARPLRARVGATGQREVAARRRYADGASPACRVNDRANALTLSKPTASDTSRTVRPGSVSKRHAAQDPRLRQVRPPRHVEPRREPSTEGPLRDADCRARRPRAWRSPGVAACSRSPRPRRDRRRWADRGPTRGGARSPTRWPSVRKKSSAAGSVSRPRDRPAHGVHAPSPGSAVTRRGCGP